MRRLKLFMLFLIVVGEVSCVDATPRASTPKISPTQEMINSWLGVPVTRIIADWGAPTKTYTISGKEYVVYVDEGTKSYLGAHGGGYSYDYVGCTWTWEISRGTIVGGNAVGPTCNRQSGKK